MTELVTLIVSVLFPEFNSTIALTVQELLSRNRIQSVRNFTVSRINLQKNVSSKTEQTHIIIDHLRNKQNI